jgi:hypothetical protein
MERTTTRKKLTPKLKEIKELLAEEEDYLRPLVGLVVSEEQINLARMRLYPDTQLLTISPREFRFTVEECSTA